MKLILKAIALTAALLVIASTGKATELSLVPEVGQTRMSSAPDDFWYEQALPHSTEFNTLSYGASLRYDVGHLQVSAGWRNLGDQHQWADIIADQTYFACKGNPSTCPKPVQVWTMTGNVQQTYAQLGYAFTVLGVRVVPGVGFAETRIDSHVNMFSAGGAHLVTMGGNVQHLPKVLYGVDVQRGRVGLGVYLLNTEPNRGANGATSPIQGSSALYARLTYNFKL